MKIKHLFLTLMAVVLAFSLVGCANRVKKDEAKETAEAFLDAVEAGDFEKAKTYLHPEKPFDVEKYFNEKELRSEIDFQKGIEIKRYTEYSSSAYDSDVGGGDFELEMNIIVDGVAFEISIDIVRNDLGYGIYDLDLDR